MSEDILEALNELIKITEADEDSVRTYANSKNK